ncbi:pyruvate formate lyase activating enzyme [Desulfuromusa kysingii]|uniref:Pyruvate formate lyase activating enzyme n=1 Tax=Desulfuromusa kysingii TaxID=37625 RepID=A0A1H3W8S0_9BACT|nr:AmmeMemoRadiSam system radical SAM enzyme [Desulfuromusa kysingii]SDZ83486.1 pyruvate formate lyase activating enzyme [Desulfuromusa kysingii]
MQEALLYQKLTGGQVCCHLCAHYCVIDAGQRGLCQVRENQNGILYTLVYGRTISQGVDPIEKKPLYHFYPGSQSFSIATPGCNFRCAWCQNWEISQMPREQHFIAGDDLLPADVVAAAQKSACRSIAYTYTEPTIFFEYSYDVATLARNAGINNIYVSNGYMSEEMLELFHPWLDAANIDLKAFRDETYRKYVGGRLQPVLDSLKRLSSYGVWLEVTTLLIPGINDDPHELQDLATFIATELGTDTPWHVSRFFPQYRLQQIPKTAQEELLRAVAIGHKAGLKYVYMGNVGEETNTYCPTCHHLLIRRNRYEISNQLNVKGECCHCGEQIAGVGMAGA